MRNAKESAQGEQKDPGLTRTSKVSGVAGLTKWLLPHWRPLTESQNCKGWKGPRGTVGSNPLLEQVPRSDRVLPLT